MTDEDFHHRELPDAAQAPTIDGGAVVGRTRRRLALALLPTVAVVTLLACTSTPSDAPASPDQPAVSAPTLPPEGLVEACTQQPESITLEDVAFIKDPAARADALEALAAQVNATTARVQMLATQYSDSASLAELAAAGQRYAQTVESLQTASGQFPDELGDATLAEGAFYAGCAAVLP